MAHPDVVVGETYSFAQQNKRSLVTGKVTGVKDGVATVYVDGKYRHLDVATARKPRKRPIRRTRRAIARGELD